MTTARIDPRHHRAMLSAPDGLLDAGAVVPALADITVTEPGIRTPCGEPP